MNFEVGMKVKFKNYTSEETRDMSDFYGSCIYRSEDIFNMVDLKDIPGVVFIVRKAEGEGVQLVSVCGKYRSNWVEVERLIPANGFLYGGERDVL